MAVNLRYVTNYKFLLLMHLMNDKPDVVDAFVESMVPKFKESTNKDFGDFVGHETFKGNSLELFLRKHGEWDLADKKVRELMSSSHINDSIIEENPSFKSLSWKNKTQANALRVEKATMLSLNKISRAIYKTATEKESSSINNVVQKGLIHTLGAKALSRGSWIPISRGIKRVMSKPVGGKIHPVVEKAGVIELATKLSKPVEETAKKHNLPVALPFQRALDKVTSGVKTAAACALVMFAVTVDKDHIDIPSANIEQHNISAVEALGSSEIPDYSSIDYVLSSEGIDKGIYDVHIESENRFGHLKDANSFDLSRSDLVVEGESLDVEQFELSFADKISAQSIQGLSSTWTVSNGESVWSIAESVVDSITDGFGVLLSDEGDPSERVRLVAEVHKEILAENTFDNPDLLHPDQAISLGTSLPDVSNASMDERMNFVGEKLNNDRTVKSQMKFI
ncbi:hypothetical protein VCHA53O466_50550 [Vibrio chagasii]|nr:hypothetical protein VCHA53O466_50550 [Vibrio chagasii]